MKSPPRTSFAPGCPLCSPTCAEGPRPLPAGGEGQHPTRQAHCTVPPYSRLPNLGSQSTRAGACCGSHLTPQVCTGLSVCQTLMGRYLVLLGDKIAYGTSRTLWPAASWVAWAARGHARLSQGFSLGVHSWLINHPFSCTDLICFCLQRHRLQPALRRGDQQELTPSPLLFPRSVPRFILKK